MHMLGLQSHTHDAHPAIWTDDLLCRLLKRLPECPRTPLNIHCQSYDHLLGKDAGGHAVAVSGHGIRVSRESDREATSRRGYPISSFFKGEFRFSR